MKLRSLLYVAAFAATASPAAADSTTWKLATSWPSSLPILNRSAEYFAENDAAMSDGRMKIEIVEPSIHKQGLGVFELV